MHGRVQYTEGILLTWVEIAQNIEILSADLQSSNGSMGRTPSAWYYLKALIQDISIQTIRQYRWTKRLIRSWDIFIAWRIGLECTFSQRFDEFDLAYKCGDLVFLTGLLYIFSIFRSSSHVCKSPCFMKLIIWKWEYCRMDKGMLHKIFSFLFNVVPLNNSYTPGHSLTYALELWMGSR